MEFFATLRVRLTEDTKAKAREIAQETANLINENACTTCANVLDVEEFDVESLVLCSVCGAMVPPAEIWNSYVNHAGDHVFPGCSVCTYTE